MFTSLREWRPPPPVRACAPPPNSAQAPLRRFPPLRQVAARLTRRDNHASLSQAPLLDTRHAKRPKSCIHFAFFQKLFRAAGR